MYLTPVEWFRFIALKPRAERPLFASIAAGINRIQPPGASAFSLPGTVVQFSASS